MVERGLVLDVLVDKTTKLKSDVFFFKFLIVKKNFRVINFFIIQKN